MRRRYYMKKICASASCTIFGMHKVFIAILFYQFHRKALLASIAVFVGYNLLNGMKAGIDNSAHTDALLYGNNYWLLILSGFKKA